MEGGDEAVMELSQVGGSAFKSLCRVLHIRLVKRQPQHLSALMVSQVGSANTFGLGKAIVWPGSHDEIDLIAEIR